MLFASSQQQHQVSVVQAVSCVLPFSLNLLKIQLPTMIIIKLPVISLAEGVKQVYVRFCLVILMF
jgi:hypothetical protein